MQSDELIGDFKNSGVLDIEKVIKLYNGYVYKIITNMVKNSLTEEDIEEIVSDVFYITWKNGDILDDSSSLKPYIATVTRNLVKNKFRNIKLNYDIDDYKDILINIDNIEQIIEQNEKNKLIADTIKNFDKESREIFNRYYYFSEKIKEIAKQMQISESKVKVKLHRIRKQLKKILKERGYGYDE